MPRRPLPSLRSCVLVAALAALSGCGGDDSSDPVSQVPEESGVQEQVRSASAPDRGMFPPAKGKTLEELADEIRGGGTVEAGLATSVFTVGENRLAFGIISNEGQFVYGPTAVYVATAPDESATGPLMAPADVLMTEPRYRSKQAAQESDPFAAVYQAQVPFRKKGAHSILVVTRQGNTMVAAPARVQVTTKADDPIPDVGESPPPVETDTLESVKGNRELLDTRTPPSDMHESSFAEVLGKKPVALLFATPQLCQSRVCGPVVDVALQLKAEYGEQVEFIHQEVYAENDPKSGLREPLSAFQLPTEPWLFITDASGKITARLEGSFGLRAFENALKTAL